VKKRGITRYRNTETSRKIDVPAKLPAKLKWIEMDKLPDITLCGPHRRWVVELLAKKS